MFTLVCTFLRGCPNVLQLFFIFSCEYLHGNLCDMCNRECLNPSDPEQQKGTIIIIISNSVTCVHG